MEHFLVTNAPTFNTPTSFLFFSRHQLASNTYKPAGFVAQQQRSAYASYAPIDVPGYMHAICSVYAHDAAAAANSQTTKQQLIHACMPV